MKEPNLNLPEERLRSWRPRPPATSLKRKIFSAARASRVSAAWVWGGLAPAAACALLALANFDSANLGGSKMEMVIVSSPKTFAIYSTDNSQSPQNHLAAVTFDWTNRSGFQSSIGFTPTTNSSN